MTRWTYVTHCIDTRYSSVMRVKNTWRMSGEPEWLSLNAMGEDGWELCGIVQMDGETLPRGIFKRPRMYQCHSCGKTSRAPDDRCPFCQSVDVHEVAND